MLKCAVFYFFITVSSLAQQVIFSGKVVDAETNNPLGLANIWVGEKWVKSDSEGNFEIHVEKKDSVISVKISYIGYTSKYLNISIESVHTQLVIPMEKQLLPAQTVLVTASINKKGETPATFSEITGEEIEKSFTTQDIPEFLSSIPSTTFYSESGNGTGYTYLSIRGFDQRRISISINGIPQNDPEDHNVYWLDFSDLLASTEFIQVQRGSGGISGYPAIGGAINIITSNFSLNKFITASSLFGSFNTKKISVAASSGFVDGKYSFFGKFSQTKGSGYRDRAWVDLKSFYFSLSRMGDNLTTQINIFGGPIKDGLVYNGLPKFAVTDKNLRRENLSYWEVSNTDYTYAEKRRNKEIENFSQPHFELLNEYSVSENITLNSALFLVIGKGFFDFDGSWADTTYLRLTQHDGFSNGETPTNTLLRGMVENKQFGWIPRIQLNHTNGILTSGLEFRQHRSLHYGSIISAENILNNDLINYRYYQFNGEKNIVNYFVNEQYNATDRIGLLAELQLAMNEYRFLNEKFVGTEFSVKHIFLNPRVGVNYKFNAQNSGYFSFARVSREPRLTDYYNAVESSGGAVPQFEKRNGAYDFTKPLVKPETMNSFDIGCSFNEKDYQINLNYFYMSFENELIKNGRLDIFGAPMMGNAKRTLHSGIEFSASVKLLENLQIIFNATYSQNKINNASAYQVIPNTRGTDYIAHISLNGNPIGGFPDFLANTSIRYSLSDFYFQLDGKYSGRFYSDNYGNQLKNLLNTFTNFVGYEDNVNDAFVVFNLFASYEVNLFNTMTKSKLFLQVNNMFNSYYSMYAIGKEFFPAAERNFTAGLQLGI